MSRRSSVAPVAADRGSRRGSVALQAAANRERRPSVFHVTGADRLTHRRESVMVAASLGMDLSSLQQGVGVRGPAPGGGRRPSIVTCSEDDSILPPEKSPPDDLGDCSLLNYVHTNRYVRFNSKESRKKMH